MNTSLSIIFLAACIAFGTATKCNGNTATFDRGTQTPRLWRWQDNSLRRWENSLPRVWHRALNSIPLLTLPFTSLDYPSDFDRLFDDLLMDPWGPGIEGPSETDDQQNCRCNENSDESSTQTEELSGTAEKPRQEADFQEYPRFQSSQIRSQQVERNTQRNDELDRESRNNLRNHQHDLRMRHQQQRPSHEFDHMGRHPSNQQPSDQRQHPRQTRQTSQGEMHTSDEGRGNFHRDRRTREAEMYPKRRFADTHHSDHLPRNRDSRVPPPSRNTQQHHVARPVQVYSTKVEGYRPSELQIQTEGRTLKVQGRRVCGCQEPCSVREFEKVFTLPDGVDTRNLQATLNKDGTLSVQSKVNQRLSHGHYENRDILVEGLDLPPIENSSENTENCVKKAGFKLAKMNKRTGERVPVTKHYDEVPQRTFENDFHDDGVTIEVVDENL